MKYFLSLLSMLICFSSARAQSYTEGADLSNTAPGDTFIFTGPSISISGQMNTPSDGSEYFVLDLGSDCLIDSVAYSITDPNPVGVSGYFQFGTNNQESYTGPVNTFFANATQFPTGAFPLIGPIMIQCQAQASVAFGSDWNMTFYGSCDTCNAPDIPTLTSSSSIICSGESVTLNFNGNLNDATEWHLYTDSCAGNKIWNTSQSSFTLVLLNTTTFYVRGEGNCVSDGNCASITVNVLPQISLQTSGDTLFIDDVGATYQWVDCDNGFAAIPGENALFCNSCLNISGNYAVIASSGNCADTSNCVAVNINGIENSVDEEIVVSLMNRGDFIFIDFKDTNKYTSVKLYDINGRQIVNLDALHKNSLHFKHQLQAGMYFMQFIADGNSSVKKIIVP